VEVEAVPSSWRCATALRPLVAKRALASRVETTLARIVGDVDVVLDDVCKRACSNDDDCVLMLLLPRR
jgi:hypothetical protein